MSENKLLLLIMAPPGKKKYHMIFNCDNQSYNFLCGVIQLDPWKLLIEMGYMEIKQGPGYIDIIGPPTKLNENNENEEIPGIPPLEDTDDPQKSNLKLNPAKRNSNKIINPVSLNKKHTLEDVIGLEEVKKVFRKFSTYKTTKLIMEVYGTKMPKGYILCGPPGVGKTYSVQAMRNEALLNGIKITITDINPSTHGSSFINQFSLNIKKEHDIAKRRLQKGQSDIEIIFLDEADDVLGKRIQDHKEDRKVSNTLNNIIDGDMSYDGIFFIGCTNTQEDIDPSFTRAGRLIPIECLPPTKEELSKLFNFYKKFFQDKAKTGVKIFENLNYKKLTELGYEKKFTGADVWHIYDTAIFNLIHKMLGDTKNADSNFQEKLKPQKVKQQELENLIINYDMIKKGNMFNKDSIGFNQLKDN